MKMDALLQQGAQQGATQVPAAVATRPAGHASQFRSISALLALQQYKHNNFQNMGGLWAGSLFLPGHLYAHKASGKVYMCLQLENKVALSWQMREVGAVPGLFELCCSTSDGEARLLVHWMMTHEVAGPNTDIDNEE